MRQYVGNGWYIKHITDRTLRIEKDDVAHRYFFGCDPFIFVRSQPGMDRQEMIHMALRQANRHDQKMALMVAEKLMPTGPQLRAYRDQLKQLKNKFQTGEEPDVIGRKRI